MSRNTSHSSIRDQFTSRKFKGGAYATVISVIVIAVVLVINLIAGEFDRTIDLTADHSASILDSTKEYIASIKDDIVIYYLAQDEVEFTDYCAGFDMNRFIDNFGSVSDNVRMIRKDPVKNPKLAKEYTDAEIMQFSYLVVDKTNGRSKYVSSNDYIEWDFNYSTYQRTIAAVDIEGQLVSALRYVTTDKLPLMYLLKGHGEAEVSQNFAAGIAKENLATEELNLMITGGVPVDCDILMIYHPMRDLLEDEVGMIEDYMAEGGSVLVFADVYSHELSNFCSLLRYYGMTLTEGYIIEGDSYHHTIRAPYEIIPDVTEHAITRDIDDDRYVCLPYSTGIMVADDIRSTVSIEPILVTSDAAYAKHTLETDTAEREAGDYTGPFYVGAEATDTYNGKIGRMIVYACLYFTDDSLIAANTFANGDVLYNTFDDLADIEVAAFARPISMEEEYVTVTEAQSKCFAALYIVAIPLLVIVAGVIVVAQRRRL